MREVRLVAAKHTAVCHNLSCEEVTFNIGNTITQIIFEKISLSILTEVFDFSD